MAESLSAPALLEHALRRWFPGEIAVVSSFGTESAVMLHMVAQVNPATPILFLDTGKLFGETLRYRDQLVDHLGLRDVRALRPDPDDLAEADADGALWARGPDACCHHRKVVPLERGLTGFAAWINGRKRHHGGLRQGLSSVEVVDGRVKLNPLAGWGRAEIERYFEAHALPRHPLEADGFASVGCMPCSDRVAPGEDARAGRWRGREKTECGIHRAPHNLRREAAGQSLG
ncbi:phosphoadenylyl-sulfate reductase [Roseospira visakhapatnamensis]|uniref:Adenosine 5'-phosphosulfate reductase n=1 Tax=Roseospira visakhapatnamensis TaxID=390880 RepID=A0A7W6WAE7_9PROT|nr:phosphoadenylyl-sulfate reductase [Roseospira visakhapatnamensis]MBB4266417.1 phosphoadenosine phosphosulfate reductase [Roseospira visakhapatnamensis]